MSCVTAEISKPDIALVVTDDALRSAMRLLLTVSGLRVDEYRTVRDYLASGATALGCLVMDCQLPDMPRRQLREQIVNLDESIAVVLVTAYPEEFDAVKAGRPDVQIISKPFGGSHLVETIGQAMRAAFGGDHTDADLNASSP